MLVTFILLILLSSAHAALESIHSKKPLYEFGIFGATAFVPDYPAADEGRVRSLAAPQFRYRGLRYRSDEEDSLKARLFQNPLYGFDLSVSGALSASSNKNQARNGMKDLDWVAEIGPRFYIFLVRTERLWIRAFLPVRWATSTDVKSFTYQGIVIAPSLSLRFYFDDSKFNSFVVSATRTHTTHQLQEFYYEVDAKDANAERPKYDANGGYLGSRAALAYLYERENTGIYMGLSVASYKGAANAGSPLHKSDYNYAAFLGFSYLFFQSEARGYQ